MGVHEVHGRTVEYTPCAKHAAYEKSGYLVLSCRKCVVRRVDEQPDEADE